MNSVYIVCDAQPLLAAIEEFGSLLSLPDSELELDSPGKFRNLIRKLFVHSVFDFSNLVRVDSKPSTGEAADVLLSFEPSDLFLELLVALRAGDRDNG